MKANLKDCIKWRASQVRETKALAAKYAKDGDYKEAARWYSAAAFHQDVQKSLEAVRDNADWR